MAAAMQAAGVDPETIARIRASADPSTPTRGTGKPRTATD
jgi:hypothetical protein